MLRRSRPARPLAMTSLAPQPSPPARVGQYEILCELGRGGMAVLYLARLVGLGGFERLFALKMIHDDLGRDPAFVQMFLDEARLVARIRHPNVVPVYEVGVDHGRYFIAMDYVSGETLGAALAATWPRQRPFPIALAMHIIAMAGEGLHAAHELTDQRGQSLGVIHRDVAPGNIMLGYDGAVRVMDFGVAKAIDQGGGASPDALKGTLAYMAPELMRGISRADRRADVFALGVLLWEMCVGKRLFKGRTDVETARRVMKLDVPVPSKGRPEISPALDDVILRALAREPGQRPATARALSEELQQVLASSGHVTTSGDVERFLREHFAERLEKRREMERKAAQETVPDDLAGVVIEEEPPLPEQVDDADIEPLSDDEVGRAPLETAAPLDSIVVTPGTSAHGAASASSVSSVSSASRAPEPEASDASALELGGLEASLALALDAAVATAIGGAAGHTPEVSLLEDGLVVVGTQRPRGDSPRAAWRAPESSASWSPTEVLERSPRGEVLGTGSMSALAALAAQEPEVEAAAAPPSAGLGPRSATPPLSASAASSASPATSAAPASRRSRPPRRRRPPAPRRPRRRRRRRPSRWRSGPRCRSVRRSRSPWRPRRWRRRCRSLSRRRPRPRWRRPQLWRRGPELRSPRRSPCRWRRGRGRDLRPTVAPTSPRRWAPRPPTPSEPWWRRSAPRGCSSNES
jgi:serine/threonine protein kinase